MQTESPGSPNLIRFRIATSKFFASRWSRQVVEGKAEIAVAVAGGGSSCGSLGATEAVHEAPASLPGELECGKSSCMEKGPTCRSDQEPSLMIRSGGGARPATNGWRECPGMRRTTAVLRLGMLADRSQQ